jgi:transposase
MSIEVATDRIAMSQRERDLLKIMTPVLEGKRSQAEAARLADLSVRQVRRLQRKLEQDGDAALVHGLRGKPSNRRVDTPRRQQVLGMYRQRFGDFGPTFACEKLAELGLHVSPDTLRRWLIAEGLWERRRQREPHRRRRPRRSCFGELVQIDASIHDWLEGRGETLVLISMIDDATSRVLARFYPSATTEAHMDLVWRWLKRYGRPVSLYSDRHSILEPQDKGQLLPDAETQFGRALRELEIGLIRAHSPQAKGRVERSFGTAQDRWVKELRLADACTEAQANAVLGRLLPGHNRRFAQAAEDGSDAHRALESGCKLAAIFSIQTERVVANDYTIRFANRFYQLLKPIYPGERGGRVIIEQRLDGSMAIRFRTHYLRYQEVAPRALVGGSTPKPPEFTALPATATVAEATDREPQTASRSGGVQPADGRSGRTPAEPYPPDGGGENSGTARKRPGKDHPWREPFKQPKR